jgi:chromosome segregation ATPase
VAEDSVLDDIELTLDEESAFETDDEESEKPSGEEVSEDTKPIVPDPDVVAELVAKKLQSSSEMEVLGPEQPKREELFAPEEKVSKWAFWRRPSKRDQQLARISEGYLEMIDLVRAIRGQLESQNENNVILRDTLSHLPDAMKGLDQGLERFSKSQQVVGKALGEIHTQMKTYNEKDERLAVSMDGFNDTLKGMDDTSKATMKTFDRVQERMRDSDIRMENLFQNVQKTEEKVSDTMVRLQRNMAVMQYIFLGCLMVVIAVLVFTVIKKQDEPNPEPQTEQVEPKPDSKNE